RYANNWTYLGRLKPGATLAQAQSQIDVLNATNLERVPEAKQVVATTGFHTIVAKLQDDMVRDTRLTIYLLWGATLFVLLIGLVNVASLVLIRSRVRLKEVATRVALGASRWRIGRQLVTEHLLLTMVAAVVGSSVGYGALQLLFALNLER